MFRQGSNQNSSIEPSNSFTWLDYIISTSPQGVMKVLANNGYTGYLAPMDQHEMYEACLDLMDKQGDQAVVDLLKSNPLFDVIAGICKEETVIKVPFKNASGDESVIMKTITSLNVRKLIENALIIIGVFYIAGKIWEYANR